MASPIPLEPPEMNAVFPLSEDIFRLPFRVMCFNTLHQAVERAGVVDEVGDVPVLERLAWEREVGRDGSEELELSSGRRLGRPPRG